MLASRLAPPSRLEHQDELEAPALERAGEARALEARGQDPARSPQLPVRRALRPAG